MEKGTWKPEVGMYAWTVFNEPFQIVVAEVFIAGIESSSTGDLCHIAAYGRSFLPAKPANFLFPSPQAALASIKVVDAKGETLNVI